LIKVKNILTIDIEEWFQCYNFEGCITRDDWDIIPSRLDTGVNKFLDILDESNTKATCFILGYVAVKHPHIVRMIAERGHEVACHGWDHKLITRQSQDEFQRETEDSVKAITDITGKEVKGYRASNFTIVKDTLWALRILAEIGFQYDSSIFPFKRSRYGISAFPRNPVRIELDNDLEIVEFPLPTMKICGKSLPAGGGGYLRLYPYHLTKWAIKELNK
jgi:polysaccharide deacetylase family protein (PEP-CTERM system associated)